MINVNAEGYDAGFGAIAFLKEEAQDSESASFAARTFEGSLPQFIAAFLNGRTISGQEAEKMISEYKEK